MALTDTEFVYLGHNNSIDLILKADSVAVSLSTTTAIKLSIGKMVINSTNASSDIIRWAQLGYATGEVRISLGVTAANYSDKLAVGKYEAQITIFGPDYPQGLVWGDKIPIRVLASATAT